MKRFLQHSLTYFAASIFLAAQCAGLPAFAQETDPTVVPSAERLAAAEDGSVRNPELKPYRRMLKGVDAFEAQHGLAPQAPLRFILSREDAKISFDGVTLAIAGGGMSIPVPLAVDGGFTLPRDQAAADANADLLLNRYANVLRWHADIRTPGLPDNVRRLGDLRLECEIGWAVTRDDAPFFLRGAVGVLGGPCRSPRAHPNYLPPHALESVTLVSGQRQEALRLHKNGSFSPPYSDSNWNDDTLLVYAFKNIKGESKPPLSPVRPTP
ncbi:MAG TPA: hypothetical protein VGP06_08830 [Janthinobacterium sp.]|nr:hypothetical protein [Janthinobacterium sp.]